MNLPYVGELQAWLADGSPKAVPVHSAQIRWQDGTQKVLIAAMENRLPLLGMALLRGNCLIINCEEEGIVEISPL